jgi:uncharacterized membrane protein YfcA
MTDETSQLLQLAGMMLATGIAGGILAGLLGVGGGIVIVPVLEFALSVIGVDPAVRMHVAVATSLATIIPTSISSARSHRKRGAVDSDLLRNWGAPIFLGSVGGVLLASQVGGWVLAAVFGFVAIGVAVKMLLPLDGKHIAQTVPAGPTGKAIPAGIGTISSMMGIGGGTLSVPTLTLFAVPIHRAVGTSALFGLLISLPAALAFVVTGWGNPLLPVGSLGYVNAIGLAIIAPFTYLFAPLGAKIAHALPKRQLGMAFGAFLLIVGVRMLLKAFGGL